MMDVVPPFGGAGSTLMSASSYGSFDPSSIMHDGSNFAAAVEFHHDSGEDRLSPFTMAPDGRDNWMGLEIPAQDSLFESWAVNTEAWGNTTM
jgi:hypothetical protein